MRHETIVGCHRHRKAVGHSQAHIGGQLAQIGHFTAHPGQIGQPHLGQGQDQRPLREMLRLGQQAFHVPSDTVKSLLQGGVAVVGQSVQLAHHLEHGGHRAGAHGAHIVHAEGFDAAEALFHIAHGFQGAFVG